ncbi:DWNN domain-containing protein [Elsinoe ampelina]|uniref:DWNN domain-containing protein n=1 Tax=Elsinoe ampelina TaxID=302913 RepID=A0A6A6GQR4_9PEZI|nr:DWNN domain-containing protein [Elsinoe ampelina]
MSSAVFFRFKSQKQAQKIPFDGASISVFELKRDIINASRLGDGTDFDFAIYHEDSNEEYDDDTTLVPKGVTVIARRLPAVRPGAGRAARYVSGKAPIMAKNQHRIESTKGGALAKGSTTNSTILDNNASEEDRIAAMLNQGSEQWEQQQQQMANQKAIHRTGYVKPQAVPDKPLPVGYTCHRCGEKGHWIQACPTNNDPTFDNRPKFKKTTGIPRSMLKVVEKPPTVGEDGAVDPTQVPQGLMYTANGEWVVAVEDSAAWEQYKEKAKGAAEKAEAVSNDQSLQEWGIECPIDKRMLVDPVKTPCCGKTYCRECIENALLSSDFVCPGCSTDGVLVDNLIEDGEAVEKVKEYETAKKEKIEKAKSASPPPEEVSTPQKGASTPAVNGTPAKEIKEQTKSPSQKPAAPVANGTPAPGTPKSTNSSTSKKRPAEDELENKRIPTGPKAMANQQQRPNQQVPQNMNDFVNQMNAMAGMPPMGPMAQMGPMGFNPMMNPMMGMPNPMMMNGMNGMNMGFGNMGMMNGNFNPNMGGNQGWQQGGGHGRGRGRGNWQQNNNFNNGNFNNQQQQNGADGAYMRQPVNPNRFQNRNRNQQQRSVDYRELGSS